MSSTPTNLIISIDLGTTFSGASWALLKPGQVPTIWDVSEFREDLPAKVPTVLYYDNQGILQAAGSETLDRGIIANAMQKKWTRVEWFKLLLRPNYLVNKLDCSPKPEMPRNNKLVTVIADFLRYLARLAHTHFHDTMDAEGNIWEEVKDRVIYILSHPNGWNTFQHPLMREAAVLAQLVPNSEAGKDRIIFVSEGEAGLHWCIRRGTGRKDIQKGSHFIVVDAGGGTINISSFKTIGTVPLEFEESSVPECYLQGSAIVTHAFKHFVQVKLKGSSFGNSEIIERMVKDFDEHVKRSFRGREQDVHVEFGTSQDNDENLGIHAGKLLVRGKEMAEFYEPACSTIADSVKSKVVSDIKTTVVLVGGFSGNQYLFKEVQGRLSRPHIQVLRAHDSASKASANGMLSFYLDRIVSTRMAKGTYGFSCVHDFDPRDPKHAKRISRVKTNEFTGQQFIEGGFFVTLKKGTVIREATRTRFPFWHSQSERTPTTLNFRLECYQGNVPDIKFRDEDSEDQFQEICWVQAVIPETSLRPSRKAGKARSWLQSAQHCYVNNFNIVLSFGTSELKIHVEWKDEGGKTRRGPVTPIWNEG